MFKNKQGKQNQCPNQLDVPEQTNSIQGATDKFETNVPMSQSKQTVFKTKKRTKSMLQMSQYPSSSLAERTVYINNIGEYNRDATTFGYHEIQMSAKMQARICKVSRFRNVFVTIRRRMISTIMYRNRGHLTRANESA